MHTLKDKLRVACHQLRLNALSSVVDERKRSEINQRIKRLPTPESIQSMGSAELKELQTRVANLMLDIEISDTSRTQEEYIHNMVNKGIPPRMKTLLPSKNWYAKAKTAEKAKTVTATFTPFVPAVFTYWINLDERGSFYADVRNSSGTTVFEIKAGDELGPHETSIFEDGWMLHKNDLAGLKAYLVHLGVMHQGQALVDGAKFEEEQARKRQHHEEFQNSRFQLNKDHPMSGFEPQKPEEAGPPLRSPIWDNH